MINGKSAVQVIVVGVAIMLGALATQMASTQTASATASDCAPAAPGAPMVVTGDCVDPRLPPNTGKVVAVEWNFEGAGNYVSAQFGDVNPAVTVKATHSYSQPGTYFPVLRATSQRDGNPDTPFGRVQNLGRARVVVK